MELFSGTIKALLEYGILGILVIILGAHVYIMNKQIKKISEDDRKEQNRICKMVTQEKENFIKELRIMREAHKLEREEWKKTIESMFGTIAKLSSENARALSELTRVIRK